MYAVEILQTVEAVGGQLWIQGDKLRVRLPESSRVLVEQIRLQKPDLLNLLADRPDMPTGVRLIRWEPKDSPVRLTRWAVVTDVHQFIRATLRQLDARLHDHDWLAGNHSLSELIQRLAAVGCHVAINRGEAVVQ